MSATVELKKPLTEHTLLFMLWRGFAVVSIMLSSFSNILCIVDSRGWKAVPSTEPASLISWFIIQTLAFEMVSFQTCARLNSQIMLYSLHCREKKKAEELSGLKEVEVSGSFWRRPTPWWSRGWWANYEKHLSQTGRFSLQQGMTYHAISSSKQCFSWNDKLTSNPSLWLQGMLCVYMYLLWDLLSFYLQQWKVLFTESLSGYDWESLSTYFKDYCQDCINQWAPSFKFFFFFKVLQPFFTWFSLHDPERVEGREEYLRLTGEGHPTDGETAKHTLPAHHIDLP